MKAPVKLCGKDLITPHPEVAKEASKEYTGGENAVSFLVFSVVVESPTVETFKTHLDVLVVTCGRCPCLGRGVGLDDLQKFFPTLTLP